MKISVRKKLAWLTLCLAGYLPTTLAIDNARFYKAAHFHGIKNRDTSDWLSKIDVDYGYGSARSGYDFKGSKTSLLNIYGDQNLLYLTTGVPKKATSIDYHTLLADLVNHSQSNPLTSSTFGKLGFNGKFHVNEFNVDYRQNFSGGLFVEAHLPVRNVKIENIEFSDKSPTTGPFTQSTAEWIQVKNNLNTILGAYGLKRYDLPYDKTDVGDLSILAGWQHTDYDEFDFLKYFSIALRAGVLIPTGSKDNTSYAFSIPTGHNEHWGIPARFDFIIGALDWLELGLHVGATFFFDRTYNRRMKTNANQSGFIKLAEGNADVERGTLWDIGVYAKFEQFYKGFSSYAGYSFNRKERDDLTPDNQDIFTNNVVNDDNQYGDWDMHTIHLMLEYDFGYHRKDESWAPRVDIHYDFPLDGKRIFATDVFGGGLGIDIKWDF